MRYITVALSQEAKPLIEVLKLKALAQHPFKIYANEHYTLIISGMGHDAMLIASTHLLSRFNPKESDIIINYGIAAASTHYEKGQLFLAHKLSHTRSPKSFYPQMLISHDFLELPLLSVDAPLSEAQDEAADMEAFAFYKAALHFSKQANIVVAKVISDHFNPKELPPLSELQAWLKENFLKLEPYIDALEKSLFQRPLFSPALQKSLHTLRTQLKLTAAQEAKLHDALKYRILKDAKEPTLPKFQTMQHKKEQKDAFNALIALLRA